MNQATGLEGSAIDTHSLDGTLGFQLRCAQLAVFRDIIAGFRDIPVTIVQFSALTVIKDNPGISQAGLASAIEVDRPRIVPVLDAMEARGWTVRKTGESDRRVRRIHLTEEGGRILSVLQERFNEHQRRMEQRLSGMELNMLMIALRRLSGR